MDQDERRTPVERRVERSFEDPDAAVGTPLSRRQRQTRRTVEQYLRGGVLPRYMERLRDIDRAIAEWRRVIGRAHRILQDECGDDREAFARRWREQANSYNFASLNELIRQHNDWYPIERQLPMDPRTRDYIKVGGRSYERPELGPDWILEQFPA